MFVEGFRNQHDATLYRMPMFLELEKGLVREEGASVCEMNRRETLLLSLHLLPCPVDRQMPF